MKLLALPRCLTVGHQFTPSHSRPGHVTCMRCRLRKKDAPLGPSLRLEPGAD